MNHDEGYLEEDNIEVISALIVRQGFLGQDRRPLEQIISTDTRSLARLGTGSYQVAEMLREVMRGAMDAGGARVAVNDHLAARYVRAVRQISPWGEVHQPQTDLELSDESGAPMLLTPFGVFPKGEIELIDGRTGKTARISPLSLHLIQSYGFFQGRGARYRLEPLMICRMLDLC